MQIGIIGIGVVGAAVKHGLEKISQTVRAYDIKYPESSLDDVLDTELCFVCVPTPSMADGACDTSIVEQTIRNLTEKNYRGLVVIKSTVTPGTTDRLAKSTTLRLAFCPEFLRERAAFTDFVENHDVCVIGANTPEDFALVRDAHGTLPKKVVHVTPLEAELSKYFSNVYNALHIIFANEFYEVTKALGGDYTRIKNAMVNRATVNDVYLDCNENFRGFGGVCLPKDTAAFAALVKQMGLDLKLFELIVDENKKFKKTVFDGMRD
jgi:UDPglucose 6-dehydrogenase